MAAAALAAAGLTDALAGEGPFTLFAPDNAAFAALPADDLAALLADPEQLAQVLLYHVSEGQALTAADLAEGELRHDAGRRRLPSRLPMAR